APGKEEEQFAELPDFAEVQCPPAGGGPDADVNRRRFRGGDAHRRPPTSGRRAGAAGMRSGRTRRAGSGRTVPCSRTWSSTPICKNVNTAPGIATVSPVPIRAVAKLVSVIA